MSNSHDVYTHATHELHRELKDALIFSSRLLKGSPLMVNGEPVRTGINRWNKVVLQHGNIFAVGWLALEHQEVMDKLVEGAEFTMKILYSAPAQGGYMAAEVRRSQVRLFDRLERLRSKLERRSDLLLAVDFAHREMVRSPLLRSNYLSPQDKSLMLSLAEPWKKTLEAGADTESVELFLQAARELQGNRKYQRILKDRAWSSIPEFRENIEKRLLAIEALLLLQ